MHWVKQGLWVARPNPGLYGTQSSLHSTSCSPEVESQGPGTALGAKPDLDGLPQSGPGSFSGRQEQLGTSGISLSLSLPPQNGTVIPGLPDTGGCEDGELSRRPFCWGNTGPPTSTAAELMAGFPSSSMASEPSVTYKFSSFLTKMIC